MTLVGLLFCGTTCKPQIVSFFPLFACCRKKLGPRQVKPTCLTIYSIWICSTDLPDKLILWIPRMEKSSCSWNPRGDLFHAESVTAALKVARFIWAQTAPLVLRCLLLFWAFQRTLKMSFSGWLGSFWHYRLISANKSSRNSRSQDHFNPVTWSNQKKKKNGNNKTCFQKKNKKIKSC